MQDENNLLSISVELGNRSYPLYVTKEEEPAIRQIEQKLQQEIREFSRRYSNSLNKQDVFAMLLLIYAKDLYDERQKEDVQSIEDRLEQLNQLLDDFVD